MKKLSERRSEIILDALIKVAAEEAWEEEMAALPALEELNRMIPHREELDKKVCAVLDAEFREIARQKRKRVFNPRCIVCRVFRNLNSRFGYCRLHDKSYCFRKMQLSPRLRVATGILFHRIIHQT